MATQKEALGILSLQRGNPAGIQRGRRGIPTRIQSPTGIWGVPATRAGPSCPGSQDVASKRPGWARPGISKSVEMFVALLLPLVVDDDADDDGEDDGHQREEDDQEQGQATHGLQGCLHCETE